jgi:hypothetical protein
MNNKVDVIDYMDLRLQHATLIFNRWKDNFNKDKARYHSENEIWEKRIRGIDNTIVAAVSGKNVPGNLEEFLYMEFEIIKSYFSKGTLENIITEINAQKNINNSNTYTAEENCEYFKYIEIPYCKIGDTVLSRKAVLDYDKLKRDFCDDKVISKSESKKVKNQTKLALGDIKERLQINSIVSGLTAQVFDESSTIIKNFKEKNNCRKNYEKRKEIGHTVTLTRPQMYLVYAFYTGIRQAKPLKNETLQSIISCLDEQRMSHFATYHLIRAATENNAKLKETFLTDNKVMKNIELIKKKHTKKKYWSEIPAGEYTDLICIN